MGDKGWAYELYVGLEREVFDAEKRYVRKRFPDSLIPDDMHGVDTPVFAVNGGDGSLVVDDRVSAGEMYAVCVEEMSIESVAPYPSFDAANLPVYTGAQIEEIARIATDEVREHGYKYLFGVCVVEVDGDAHMMVRGACRHEQEGR